MTNSPSRTPLSTFAFIAGLGILLMMTSPFAEFGVYNKLVTKNAVETIKNLSAHRTLFTAGILCYLFNFLCDIVVAWALYNLLRPVSESLSLLTAWFQLVYAVMSLVALLHLVTVLRMLDEKDYSQVAPMLHAFRDGWSFGFFFFGLHLVLLGYLVFRSAYIPRIMGVFLIIAGSGYLINMLQPYLFAYVNIDYITITYFGELIFMFWLLFRGLKIKEPTNLST